MRHSLAPFSGLVFFEKSLFELPICRLFLFTVCVAILQLPVGL